MHTMSIVLIELSLGYRLGEYCRIILRWRGEWCGIILRITQIQFP